MDENNLTYFKSKDLSPKKHESDQSPLLINNSDLQTKQFSSNNFNNESFEFQNNNNDISTVDDYRSQTTHSILLQNQTTNIMISHNNTHFYCNNPLNSYSFMYMKVKIEVSKLNVISLYVIQFVTYLIINFMTSFLSYIIQSNDYYNIDEKVVGNVLGTLSFYSEIAVIISDFGIGLLMDLMGRKYPIIIGLFISGISIAVIPYGTQIYPYLCIFKVLVAVGVLPAMNSPLIPDYIEKRSQGLANSYSNIVITFATIISTSLVIQLQFVMDLKYCFLLIGCIVLVSVPLLLIGIKDLKYHKQISPNTNHHMTVDQSDIITVNNNNTKKTWRQTMNLAFTQLYQALRYQPEYIIAILIGLSSKMASICFYQFGPIYFKFILKSLGESQDYADDVFNYKKSIQNYHLFITSYTNLIIILQKMQSVGQCLLVTCL